MATEAPRVIVDQLAREPEGLCASLALALESVAHPKQRLAFDAMLVVGPEHANVFRAAGWSKRAGSAEGCSTSRTARPVRSPAERAARRRGSTRSS